MMMLPPPPLSPERRAEFKAMAYNQLIFSIVCIGVIRVIPAVLGYGASA